MWVDLTKTIKDGMETYADDPKTVLKQVKNIEKDGYSLYQLSMGMHTSTHIDTPRHMLQEGKMVDELPLSQLIGRAVLIDVRAEDVVFDTHKGVDKIEQGDMVLVCGGSSNTRIDASFARLLIRKNVKVLGLDFASPDEAPFLIHKLLFAKEILIVEHLCCLEDLFDQPSIELVIAPLKIHADGAIARVYANIQKAKE